MTTGSGLSAGTGLGALLAAIQRSPIVVRFASQLSQDRDWASRDWASWQKIAWAGVRRSAARAGARPSRAGASGKKFPGSISGRPPDLAGYVLAGTATPVPPRLQPRSFI